jgi:hypothetical protein
MNKTYKRMIKLYTEQRRRILDPEIADANSRNLTRRGHSQFTRGEGGGTGQSRIGSQRSKPRRETHGQALQAIANMRRDNARDNYAARVSRGMR